MSHTPTKPGKVARTKHTQWWLLNKRKQRFRPKPQISQKQNRNSNRKYCALRNTVFGGQKQKFKLQKKILTETEKWCLSDREYSYFDKKKDKNRK